MENNFERMMKIIESGNITELKALVDAMLSKLPAEDRRHFRPAILLKKFFETRRDGYDNEECPMKLATEKGHTEIVEYLASEMNVDVQFKRRPNFGFNPFQMAAYKGNLPLVQKLLEIMPELLETKNRYGNTGLNFAAVADRDSVVRYLVEYGANVNNKGYLGRSVISMGLTGFFNPDLLSFLIENGADCSVGDDNGDLPVHFAAETDQIRSIEILLQHCGESLDVANNNGETPLIKAAMKGKENIVKHLMANGAESSKATSNGETALHYAARNGHLKALKALLDNADPEMTDKDGNTILHVASKDNKAEIVRHLLEAYPTLASVANKDGKLAKDLTSQQDIATLFHEHAITNVLSTPVDE